MNLRPLFAATALAALAAPPAHARTFALPGTGAFVHFDKNTLTICRSAETCQSQPLVAQDVIRMDDNWFFVLNDAHTYTSCMVGWCEPTVRDVERGWLGRNVGGGGGGTAAAWRTVATENQGFTVSGTQTVRYGSGTSWITMPITGAGECSNAYFGADPIVGVFKECQEQAGSGAWTSIAGENAPFTVSGTQVVRYGAGDSWATKTVTGSGECSNGFFGYDPIWGVVKECQTQSGGGSSSGTGGWNWGDCYFNDEHGLRCTRAEPFQRGGDLVFGDFLGNGTRQALSISQGQLCEVGGRCRTARGLGLLASATRIAALSSPARIAAGIVGTDAARQTACRKFGVGDTTVDFQCFQTAANDAPELEPFVVDDSIMYVPKAGTTAMAHVGQVPSGGLAWAPFDVMQPNDNVNLADALNRSFEALNRTTLGQVAQPVGEPVTLFTVDIPAYTSASLALRYGADANGAVFNEAYTLRWWSDAISGKWPTKQRFEVCTVVSSGGNASCSVGDDERSAAFGLLQVAWCPPGALCGFQVASWGPLAPPKGVLAIEAAAGFNPTNPPIQYFETTTRVSEIPMTRTDCEATCRKISTIQANHCGVTARQIGGAGVALGLVGGIASGYFASRAAGAQAGVEAGVKIGGIFMASTATVAIGYDQICDAFTKNRQSTCLVKVCGG